MSELEKFIDRLNWHTEWEDGVIWVWNHVEKPPFDAAAAELAQLRLEIEDKTEALGKVANPREAHILTDIEIARAVLAKYPGETK